MTDKNRRKLAAYGSTKVVDGITFTASAFMMDGEVNPNFIEWNGGARGGIVRERAGKTATGTCGFTHQPRVIALSRFEWENVGRETFHPIARLSIAAQRNRYREAKTLVEAFEAEAAR
ncbi:MULTISPECIES: hypothetical protein [Sphingomonas]|uniref:Uncharacterized protein n=1 Tax=Sphingomonas aracearum TaxID=2283317 RepID=A0A369VYS7_9SPHN|nr:MULTISPECIES: hypothetical protein [Sphingomonas]ATI54196.1 hypothetical protein CP552_00290 [Sphingomonas melonis]RDE06787.1 hypothetical protein DVW87_03630 [Sphingomonas aracearum]